MGLTRYHSGSPIDTANHLTWVAPLGSASKKQLKTRIPERFSIPKGSAKGAREITSNRQRLPPHGFPKGGGEGGGGGRIRPKLEFWRLFAIGHLFKSSRIQDGNARRKSFHPAASPSHIATNILHHTACKSTVATGKAKTRAAFEFWRFFWP